MGQRRIRTTVGRQRRGAGRSRRDFDLRRGRRGERAARALQRPQCGASRLVADGEVQVRRRGDLSKE